MAIIACPECGKEVSDQAPKCIHCGYPLKKEESTKIEKGPGLLEKTPKKVLATVCSIALLIVLVVVFLLTNITPSARYKKAEAAFKNENYGKAMKYYLKAGNYEDATIKLETSTILYNYQIGVMAIEKEEWQKGKDALVQCAEYEDASALIQKCDYGLACQLLTDGKYEEAKDAFEELGVFNDAPDKIKECNYHLARKLEEEGKIPEAAQMYGEADAYEDSDDRIRKFGDKYLEEKDYINAYATYMYLSSEALASNKSIKYAEGQVKLQRNELAGAAEAFINAGDFLDAQDLFKSTTYEYANSLLDKKDYSGAKIQYAKISGYQDSSNLSNACDLMLAKDNINNGNLNSAKAVLEKMDSSVSYKGVNATDLLELLKKNSQWVDLCGKWTSTGGQMRTTQNGSYNNYWWYRDFAENDVYLEVKCKISDSGKITVKLNGSIPIYTNYSSISAGLKESKKSLDIEKEMSSLGTIKIDDITSVTLSSGKIVANYKKNDRTADVYFTYTYKTDVTYGKRKNTY